MEFYYLPEEHRVIHTASFELIRQIEEFIVGKDYQFLQITSSKLSLEDKVRLDECGDFWDFLKKYKEEQFYSLLNKHLILGLLKDFCYFMQESMDCSNKMRLVISYTLLRRPIVDNLKILLRILMDDSFYDNFIEKDDYDPTYMKNEDLKSLLDKTDDMRFIKPITGSFMYECIFEKANPGSIINLSNRAIHPVTNKPWNKTGSMNCNFMFTTPEDTAELWKHYYTYLPSILMFYSELFNCAVFGLFKDEVNMDLYPKRIEKLAKIMETAFPKKG